MSGKKESDAWRAGETKAWNDWTNTRNKTGFKKFFTGTATFLLLVGSWVLAANGHPEVLCVDPFLIGGGIYLTKKMENNAQGHWQREWLNIYRSDGTSDAKNQVIDQPSSNKLTKK